MCFPLNQPQKGVPSQETTRPYQPSILHFGQANQPMVHMCTKSCSDGNLAGVAFDGTPVSVVFKGNQNKPSLAFLGGRQKGSPKTRDTHICPTNKICNTLDTPGMYLQIHTFAFDIPLVVQPFGASESQQPRFRGLGSTGRSSYGSQLEVRKLLRPLYLA